MLHRPYDPAVIYRSFRHKQYKSYAHWREKAQLAKDALLADPQTAIDTKVYGASKDCLTGYFFEKCSYCESKFKVVSFGDVEHFRPKREVTEDASHPGYYWLAYEESNLLISCEMCNRARGKLNHFPLDHSGVRAYRPGDNLDRELPVLLNPYIADDCAMGKHLKFIFEEDNGKLLPTGRVEGIGKRGEESARIYNLSRRELVNSRKNNQADAIRRLRLAEVEGTLLAELKLLLDPTIEHAAAIRATCREWMALRDRLTKKAQAMIVGRVN